MDTLSSISQYIPRSYDRKVPEIFSITIWWSERKQFTTLTLCFWLHDSRTNKFVKSWLMLLFWKFEPTDGVGRWSLSPPRKWAWSSQINDNCVTRSVCWWLCWSLCILLVHLSWQVTLVTDRYGVTHCMCLLCIWTALTTHVIYLLLVCVLAVPFWGAQYVLFNVCKHFRISF